MPLLAYIVHVRIYFFLCFYCIFVKRMRPSCTVTGANEFCQRDLLCTLVEIRTKGIPAQGAALTSNNT